MEPDQTPRSAASGQGPHCLSFTPAVLRHIGGVCVGGGGVVQLNFSKFDTSMVSWKVFQYLG